MKSVVLLICFTVLFACVQAQQSEREKLEDIVAKHEQYIQQQEKDHKQKGNLEEAEEDDEYHFDRWVWYNKQNTDKDGYVVSQSQAWNKLGAYRSNSANKTTATVQADWHFWGVKSNTTLFLGAYGQGQGRIYCMGFHPTDKNTFWIGSSSGGAWRTTDFGLNWKCMTDNLPSVLSIADIDINPKNPNVIYLSTGDRDANFDFGVHSSGGAGVGVLKSTDGGLTWNQTGFHYNIIDGVFVNSLVINPVDTSSLTIATRTVGGTPKIYKSNNGGATWKDVTPSAFATGMGWNNFWELVYNAADTNYIYCSALDSDLSSNRAVRILVSSNGGYNWTATKTYNTGGRATIAVSRNQPNLIKVLASYYNSGSIASSMMEVSTLSKTGALVNTNYNRSSGNCFDNYLGNNVYGNDCGGQGMYDLSFAVDPANFNHLVLGGVNAWESWDGGGNWNILSQWVGNIPGVDVVHADKHMMAYHPLDSTYLMECNDGGIFYKHNGFWQNITPGLGITQFYRNAVSYDGSFVLGGSQDNGTHLVRNGYSQQVGYGDGEECQVDFVDSNMIYWSSQYGALRAYDRTTPLNFGNIIDIQSSTGHAVNGAWTTPFLLDPNDHNTIVAAYDNVYSSHDQGFSWGSISPTFNRNIHRLTMSAKNSLYIYAVEDVWPYPAIQSSNTTIHYTSVGGTFWSTLTPPFPETQISDIKADLKDATHFWITYAGWGNTTMVAEYKPGSGWKSISENLPAMPIYCIQVDSSDGTLYVGTYDGVYYRPVDSNKWQPYNTSLPHVSVMDLDISYVSGQLYAATWGRGMWVSPKYNKYLGVYQGIPYAYKQLTVYPNPASTDLTIVSDVPRFNNQKVRVILVDVNGQVAWQSEKTFSSNKLSIANLHVANGVYSLRITSEDGRTSADTRVVISK